MIADRVSWWRRCVLAGAAVFFFVGLSVQSMDAWRTIVDYLTPTASWVDFRSIEVPDFRVGEDPVITNTRGVKRTITVDYAAEITEIETNRDFCQGRAEGVQMQITTDDTWRGAFSRFVNDRSNPMCPANLPPGRYVVEMTLCFETRPGNERCFNLKSNEFEVLP